MKKIELLNIEKQGRSIRYVFVYSDELSKYFTGEEFLLEYPENIESVPNGVLAVPFVSNTLQISWLTDCELIIPELDQDFYESIPAFQKGFEKMFPETTFAGKLIIKNIVKNTPSGSGYTAAFFSGGLDATTTLIRHFDECPHLISIWGSDVDFNNVNGWGIVEKGLRETSEQYELPLAVIRSNFRRFDDSVVLTKDFQDTLKTSWWYGLKHGLGLIGHAAPYVWLHGISTVYIASSHCPENGKIRCSSDPSTDSKIAFCNCAVSHDAFELNRQKKTRVLADYHRNNPEMKIHLHVCYKSEDGVNCSNCEKCYRTMVGLWIEGADPYEYGFQYDQKVLKRMYECLALRGKSFSENWKHVQQGLKDNWDVLEGTWYRDQLKWVLDFDFEHPEENECRKKYRASWKYKQKIIDAFPRLYGLYIKFRGYRFE